MIIKFLALFLFCSSLLADVSIGDHDCSCASVAQYDSLDGQSLPAVVFSCGIVIVFYNYQQRDDYYLLVSKKLKCESI